MKKILSVLLSILLVAGMCPTVAWAAEAAACDVVISETNGQIITFTAEQCDDNCQGHTITQNAKTAQNTTILVESGTHNITFSGLKLTTAKVGVMPGGTMNLTLDGTNSISVSRSTAGIYVPVGATLVITEQNAGSLNVSGNDGGAGIGGSYYAPSDDYDNTGDLNCGTVIINGGTITATGGSMSAGIGGASGSLSSPIPGNGGTITINGGTVTATGGSDGYYGGAGIGGGSYDANKPSGCGGTLTINGGKVTMTAGTHESQYPAYGFGQGSGRTPSGTCELILADASCLAKGTTLDPNGTYTVNGDPTEDMIVVPEGLVYNGEAHDMTGQIYIDDTKTGTATLFERTFTVRASKDGWVLQDLCEVKAAGEYTAKFKKGDKAVSKTFTVEKCPHSNLVMKPLENGMHGGTCPDCNTEVEPAAHTLGANNTCADCGVKLAVKVQIATNYQGDVAPVYFDTIESAWAFVTESDLSSQIVSATITLLDDVTANETLTVEDGDNITFDGGAHTLTSITLKSSVFEVTGGQLTMQSGIIVPNAFLRDGIKVNGGTLVVVNGKIEASRNGINAGYGLVQISGGEIIGQPGLYTSGDGSVQISGGTFKGIYSDSKAIESYNGKVSGLLAHTGATRYAYYQGETPVTEGLDGKFLLAGPFTVKECTGHVYTAKSYQHTTGATTHTQTCAACGAAETANCKYDTDVTPAQKKCVCGAALTAALVDANGLTYTGAEIKPEVAFTVDGATQTVAASKAYSNNVNAGKGSVGVTSDVFAGTFTLEFNIAKATPVVTAPSLKSLTYTGQPQELVEAGSATVGAKVVYSLTQDGTYAQAIPTATDAGSYDVWFKVEESGNYNGVSAKAVTAEINKAEYAGTKAVSTSGKYGTSNTYDLAGLLPEGYVLGEVVTQKNDDAILDSVTLSGTKLTYALVNEQEKVNKTATLKVPVESSTNYEPFDLTITVTVTDKIPVTITGVTAQSGTYNGGPHTGYTGTPASEYAGKYTVTYSGGTAPTDAGDYTVTIAVPDNDETYTGSVTLDFTISKARVTIIADDKEATVGEEKPEFTYTVKGLLGSDTLAATPTLSCSPDMSKAGVNAIIPSGADAGSNYEIAYESGTLYVKAADTDIKTEIVQDTLTKVPSGLTGTKFNTVEKIQDELTKTVVAKGYTAGNTSHYDVTLKYSLDGGTTWIPATEDNFPAEGITIVLDYPDGTGKNTHDFVVSHMFTATSAKLGTVAGETEQPVVKKLDNGIEVTLKGLSPVAIAWKKLSSSGSGGGGGWVSYYSVNLAEAEHGKVTADRSSAYSGGTVTLTVTPDEGYKLDSITVTDSQNKGIELTENNGKYTFKMPGGHVTVSAVFAPEQSETPSPSPWENPFPDVKNTWYLDAIEFVCTQGLMEGYSNGKFGPDDNLTRAQFAQILYNKEGKPSATDGKFTDVTTGWYANAVNWAAEAGIVAGVGNGKFAPNKSIIRQDLAVMLWLYAGSPEPKKNELDFTDAGKVSEYAWKAMLWANENGIVNGKGNGKLDPKGNATRAEAAQMLMNYLK